MSFSDHNLTVYYQRLFPYDQLFSWLNYGGVNGKNENDRSFFNKREMSFTIENDIYIRYQSFKDKEDMKKQIQKMKPYKIDIGAVFTVPPKEHSTVTQSAFKPVERELVFDIDLSDYDDVRTCCAGAAICQKCWSYMTMAVKVLDVALKEDFGFSHVLWVYSGRRGVHCWICDPLARTLPNDARSSIASYLTLVSVDIRRQIDLTATLMLWIGCYSCQSVHILSPAKGGGGEGQLKNVACTEFPLHYSIQRAVEILEPLFTQSIIGECGEQLLTNSDSWKKLLDTLPYPSLADELNAKWGSQPHSDPLSRWQQVNSELLKVAERENRKGKKPKPNNAASTSGINAYLWKHWTVLYHGYPRLDVNVSTHMNHLLKSPFVVHPKTGRICVPIDPKTVDDFNPDAVPTLKQLISEIDSYSGSDATRPDLEKTSLHRHVQFFEHSFLNPLLKDISQRRKDASDKVSAVTLDF